MDPDLDPDPLVRGTDARIRIRTGMSRGPQHWLEGTDDATDDQGDGEDGTTPEGLSAEFEQLWAGAGHACCLQVRWPRN